MNDKNGIKHIQSINEYVKLAYCQTKAMLM